MDKKILKYKAKKNKLENELMDILMTKKANYENDIINSNNNSNIINKIENFLNTLKLSESSESNQLFVIVKGDYSVGKSTFISHLKNYISKMSKIILGQNSQLEVDLIKIIKSDDFDVGSIENSIVIVELNNVCLFPDTIENIVKLKTGNVQILNINILPKDAKSLKNKYINKIINDINSGTNDFVSNLNLNLDLDQENKTNIQNNIGLLKLKSNEYFSDEDFNFLNEPVEIIFNSSTKHNLNLNTDEIVFYI